MYLFRIWVRTYIDMLYLPRQLFQSTKYRYLTQCLIYLTRVTFFLFTRQSTIAYLLLKLLSTQTTIHYSNIENTRAFNKLNTGTCNFSTVSRLRIYEDYIYTSRQYIFRALESVLFTKFQSRQIRKFCQRNIDLVFEV